jgi:hypothetical protein
VSGNTITIGKVDQFGNLLSAFFAIQSQNADGSWTTITTVAVGYNGINGGSSTANPNSTGALSNGTYRIIEAASGGPSGSPQSCTLVDVAVGLPNDPNKVEISPLQPAIVTLPAPAGSRNFTFINSCLLTGSPSAAGSQLVVVVGGSSQGVTNTANVEIYPAPGSDDDARIDIRVRDSANIPCVGCHVTIFVDKGTIAMRTQATSATNTQGGIDVLEPSGTYFGQNVAGDTCDYFLIQSVASGSLTTTQPYVYTSLRQQDGFTNVDGVISACWFFDSSLAPGVAPGKATVTAIVEQTGANSTGIPAYGGYNGFAGYDCNSYNPNPFLPVSGVGLNCGVGNLILTGTVTVVGPPSSITVTASPTSLNCGEKSTVTVTVKDAAGQNVSDHTRIEAVTNFGGVIGGTGSTLGFPGVPPTGPLSSGAAETFSGVATLFLLTATDHVGPYEVVVASGGSTGGTVLPVFTATTGSPTVVGGGTANIGYPNTSGVVVNSSNFFVQNPVTNVYGNTGAFSTPPVSAQVTVTCAGPAVAAPSIPAPAISAPRTGEGASIRPPNTGDAGLAASSTSDSMSLFVVVGAVFVLAGVATVKFARR